MYKVLFFITGIGWGDSIREWAIIKELQKKEKLEIKIAGYKTSYNFFKNKIPIFKIRGFDIVSPRFRFEFLSFMRKNAILPLTWNAQIKKLQKELKNFKPDLIITDFEPLGALFAKKTKTKFIEIFGVEPKSFNEFVKQKKTDFFTNLQIIYLKKLYDFGNKYGKAVVISTFQKTRNFARFKFINPIVRKAGKKRTEEGIVVILGGSSFGAAMGKHLAKVLPEINEKFLIFGWPKRKRIKNCYFFPATENVLHYLKNSSGVISLAGYSTISEALVFKKPLLVFPIPNHIEQAYNAWLLKKKKLAMVKEFKSIDEKILEQTIREFIRKKEDLKKRVRKIKIKGNGAEQAAKIIFDILKSD
ncbi:hypothetical protein B6U80_01010 [Candidatus Pacearchaeota archaeon ex4484_26]|nr:MAG: hypothetical protein B6U80_01010 [Candidatus Pacearchaeota archaeon ex4484_26]